MGVCNWARLANGVIGLTRTRDAMVPQPVSQLPDRCLVGRGRVGAPKVRGPAFLGSIRLRLPAIRSALASPRRSGYDPQARNSWGEAMAVRTFLIRALIVAGLTVAIVLPVSAESAPRGLAAAAAAYKHRDYAEAFQLFKPLAEDGNPAAEYSLGTMYHLGQWIPKDDAQAVIWFRKAGDQGYAYAEYALGLMYGNGSGVPVDITEAQKWYGKAAEQGNAPAIAALAELTAKQLHVGATQMPTPAPAAVLPPDVTEVAVEKQGGTFVVPVLINNAITLNFTLDSGATDVNIPVDVVTTLIRAGTISDWDFFGTKSYTLANGTTGPSPIFRIRSLKVGDIVLVNITGSISPHLLAPRCELPADRS